MALQAQNPTNPNKKSSQAPAKLAGAPAKKASPTDPKQAGASKQAGSAMDEKLKGLNLTDRERRILELAQNAPGPKSSPAPPEGSGPAAGGNASPATANQAGTSNPAGGNPPGQQPAQQPPGQPAPSEGEVEKPPAGNPPAGQQPGQKPPVTRDGRAVTGGEGQQPGDQKEGGLKEILPRNDKKGKAVAVAAGTEVPLFDFLRFLADYTGLPLLYDTADTQLPNRKINFIANTEGIDFELAKAMLETNKIRVFQEKLTDGREVIKVESMVQQPTGPGDPKPIRVVKIEEISALASQINPDEYATMVFTLENIEPRSAIDALQNLISGVGGGGAPGAAGAAVRRGGNFSMAEVQNSAMLIITAKFGLLGYLKTLLQLIDLPEKIPERILRIIQIEWAAADEISGIIQEFLQGTSGAGLGRFGRLGQRQIGARIPTPTPGQPVTSTLGGQQVDYSTKLISDYYTNKIFIVTYSDQDLQDIEMLLSELDVKPEFRRLRTHIYRVRYLKAIEVAQDLQLLIQGATSGGGGGLSGMRRGATGAGTTGARGRTGGLSGLSRRTSGIGRAGGIPTTAGGPQPTTGGSPQNAPLPSLIVPHEPTNSLLIQAEPEEYDEILNILSKIDTKRRQVFLEAALVQVQSGSSLNYSIELIAGNPDDNATRGLFAQNFGLTGIDLENWQRVIPDLSDPTFAPRGGFFALMSRGKLPAIITFFKSNNESQILATPFILADDNEENRIDVLETRYVQNTSTQQGGVNLTSQTGEPAGITLAITPTISGAEEAVFLTMELTVSDFQDAVLGAQTLPPKNENTMTSSVTIPDGHVFVVGGLTRENKSKVANKIPILGDIPILGKLFRSESNTKSQNNLYVFLQAHILTDEEFRDGIDITQQADKNMRTFREDIQQVKFQRPEIERRRVRTLEEDEEFPVPLKLNPKGAGAYDPFRNYGPEGKPLEEEETPGKGAGRDYNGKSPEKGAAKAAPPAAPPAAPAAPPRSAPKGQKGGQKTGAGWLEGAEGAGGGEEPPAAPAPGKAQNGKKGAVETDRGAGWFE